MYPKEKKGKNVHTSFITVVIALEHKEKDKIFENVHTKKKKEKHRV